MCAKRYLASQTLGRKTVTDARCVWLFFRLSNSHEAEDTASPTQIMSHADQRIK